MQTTSDSKSVLILPDKRIDIDLIAASVSLAESFSKSGNKVRLLLDEDNYPDFLKELLPVDQKLILNESELNEFVIELPNDKTKIKNLDWEQKDDKLRFFITTEDELRSELKVTRKITEYSKVITLGKAEDPKSKSDSEFEKSKKEDITYSQNYKNNPRLEDPISIKVLEFLKSRNLTINSKVATNLLAGIYWKTTGFTENFTDRNVFKVVAELVDLGADIKVARKIAFNNLKKIEIDVINELLRNLNYSKRIVYSVVDLTKFKNFKFRNLIFKHWSILRFLQSADIVISIFQMGDLNEIFIYNNSEKNYLNELSKKFKIQHNQDVYFFKSSEKTDEIMSILLNVFNDQQTDKFQTPNNNQQIVQPDTSYRLPDTGSHQNPAENTSTADQPTSADNSRKQLAVDKKQIPNNNQQVGKSQNTNDKSQIDEQTPNNNLKSKQNQVTVDNSRLADQLTTADNSRPADITNAITDPLAPATEYPKALNFEKNSNSSKPKKFTAPLAPAE